MSNIMQKMRIARILRMRFAVFAFICSLALFALPSLAFGATLSLEPSAGAFIVGSTFNVSILLDTEDESINALEVHLNFPPDKLQVVEASTGFSIVNTWTSNPSFNNRDGSIDFKGVIPSGIYANKGLISTITFRARSVGSALVRFTDISRVLLNNGQGTDVLRNVANGIYQLILPPPAGPLVVSETHPNQSKWYSNSNIVFRWATEPGMEGYSYVLNSEPIDISDDISEGVRTGTAYKNIADGTHYFHIKSLRNGVWGGTTHYALNIDTEPPAAFHIEVLPFGKTTNKNPIIRFQTTDALSGVDYYEYKVISLKPNPELNESNQNFFIEAQSPQVLSLELGDHDIIIRAYDKAGNFREVVKRLKIVTQASKIISSFLIWVIMAFLIVILGYVLWRVRSWHHGAIRKSVKRKLYDYISKQLKELKKYQQKYGKT